MAAAPVQITSLETLSSFLSSNSYAVIDFYADWCPPCKAIAPLYAKMAADNTVPGHLAFAKVNVDNVPDVGTKYGVTAMPTFMFFSDGEPTTVSGSGATGPCIEAAADGSVKLLRGADPRALNAVVGALNQAAKKKATVAESAAETTATTEKKEEEGEKPAAEDTTTVSGGYSMGQSGEKRADWKMSLQG